MSRRNLKTITIFMRQHIKMGVSKGRYLVQLFYY